MITAFNKSAPVLTNQTCVEGCGSFRASKGTPCPRCGSESKPQATVATVAPGFPETKGYDF